jgi:hypothetical protein
LSDAKIKKEACKARLNEGIEPTILNFAKRISMLEKDLSKDSNRVS